MSGGPASIDGPFDLDERPAYRAMVIADSRAFIGAIRLAAESDKQAIELAKNLAGRHSIELWDGLRFIEHFRRSVAYRA